jgi:dCTP deaminase
MIVNGFSLLTAAPIHDMIPRKVSSPDFPTSYGLGEIGYDIRIKQDVHFYPASRTFPNTVYVTDPTTKKSFSKKGRFCLASSIEEFGMPDNLGAVGHDKSTYARMGVQVFNTVIEPGWNGFLTIELVFNGEEAVFIPAGTGIMQIIFHQLTDPTSYDGKYQGQADAPVPAKTTV